MSVRAIFSSLPYKIKSDIENEIWRKYTANCLRILTENTANMSQGKFISVKYEDIIDPKPQENRSSDEIIDKIKDKIDRMK